MQWVQCYKEIVNSFSPVAVQFEHLVRPSGIKSNQWVTFELKTPRYFLNFFTICSYINFYCFPEILTINKHKPQSYRV